jgi:transposase-like protein
MSQHFLLTAAARTISLKHVLRMEEAAAWAMFCTIRWPESDGAPVCPHCACPTCWACPRSSGTPRFRCTACRRDFSPTSGTLFAFHKLPIRDYLAAVVLVCDEVKGKAALALSRDLDVQDKTAFVLAHKLREAMAAEFKGRELGGADRPVEIDGCFVGGHVRPENRKADRQDRRLAQNQSGKRQVVVVIRERALSGTSLGGTIPAVFASEDAALSFIKARVDRATTVHADESPAWNALHARFDTRRINHSVEYANDDACINQAEAYFARLRRGERGHYHRIAGVYLIRYAREAAWKQDHRRDSNGQQVHTLLLLVTRNGPSVDFCGYWQPPPSCRFVTGARAK